MQLGNLKYERKTIINKVKIGKYKIKHKNDDEDFKNVSFSPII